MDDRQPGLLEAGAGAALRRGFDSWEAFARAGWDEALRLIGAERDFLSEFQRENAKRGTTPWRVRVVEEPLTPYLQWELRLLRPRAECGERIRVVGPEHVAEWETAGSLPELVTLGNTAYQVLYAEQGTLCGAVRFADPAGTAGCRDFMQRLYALGEDMSVYLERAVAHVPPPNPARP